MNWLFKEEPTNYSYDALARGKNHVDRRAQPARAEAPAIGAEGRRIFFYHTGDREVRRRHHEGRGPAYPDPADKTGKLYAVDVVPVKKLAQTGDARVDQGRQGVRDVRARALLAVVGDAGQRTGVGKDRENGTVTNA